MRKETNAVQVHTFSKEFRGFEIESKWELLTQETVLTIVRMVEDIRENRWFPFKIQEFMGSLPVGIRFFKIDFMFFGTREKNPQNPTAMVAKFPGRDSFLLSIKNRVGFLESPFVRLSHPPMIRTETRTSRWIPKEKVMDLVSKNIPGFFFAGVITREKCSVYITNTETRRNFNISADLCQSGTKTLSQLEIEYKGRDGVWPEVDDPASLLLDFSVLHKIIERQYGSFLRPTDQTKFNWLLSS